MSCTRMTEASDFSPISNSCSQIFSDAEDWDESEVKGKGVHCLPLAELDPAQDLSDTNKFLRKGGLSSKKGSSVRTKYARKFFTDPKKLKELKDGRDTCHIYAREVELTPSSCNSNLVENKVVGSSFLDRPYKKLRDAKISSNTHSTKSICDKEISKVLPELSEKSNIRINSREDGTTVITSSHPGRDQEASRRPKGNSGWGNNFVRLNLKKKNTFGRVKGAQRFVRKKSRWRTEPLRQVGDGSSYLSGWEQRNSFKCYHCGQAGHFASDCKENQVSEEHDTSLVSGDRDVLGSALNFPRIDIEEPVSHDPLYKWNTETDLHGLLESKFGHKSFRGNQLEIITQILQGNSCLNIMPTGMGKSLCYQLPAFLLSSPVIVISPLIALMQDQCEAAPTELNPSILWSGQTPQEALQTLDDLKTGKTRLLFISPERASNEHFLEAIKIWLPLDLLVIDEAHCISEWGHSFRPSYYRLGKVIRSVLPAKSILALTATATLTTELCIRDILSISKENSHRIVGVQDNMHLKVEQINHSYGNFEKWQRIAQKLKLLLNDCRRAILYCSFRKDADNLAKAIALLGLRAKSYHSGISSTDRKKILTSFTNGIIRVVVATTAFGMGINISAVDAVVHVSMPRSLEEYTQQIGRAGRNGGIAQCICYLDRSDFLRLRSLCSNPYICRSSVSDIIDNIFGNLEKGKYGILDLGKLADGRIPEETVESIICFLENNHGSLLTYYGSVPLKARVSFYAQTPEEMEDPLVSSILQACPKPRQGVYHVRVDDLCNKNGDTPAKNFKELAAMSRKSLIGFQASKEKGPFFRIESTVSVKQKLDLIDEVTLWLEGMNSMVIQKLDIVHKAFNVVALLESDQGNVIREILNHYFSCSSENFDAFLNGLVSRYRLESEIGPCVKRGGPETLVAAKAVLRRAREHNLKISASEVSSILHGRFESIERGKGVQEIMNVFWGRLQDVDHRDVLAAARIAMDEE